MNSSTRTMSARTAVRSPRIIAIASGKGGVGKTWLAITLAHALAKHGRRTLLFDGDFGLANVDVQLGLMPGRDLFSVLEGRVRFEDVAVTYQEGGFDIVAGRSGSGRLADISFDRLHTIDGGIRALARVYDHVILDLGAGIEHTVRQLSRIGDLCIVCATSEPTSLTDAYVFVKRACRDRSPDAVRIVVNMASSVADGEHTYSTLRKTCESFLNISPPLLGIIRRDLKVPDAIRHQTSLLIRYPNSDAAADVESIAASLLQPQLYREAQP